MAMYVNEVAEATAQVKLVVVIAEMYPELLVLLLVKTTEAHDVGKAVENEVVPDVAAPPVVPHWMYTDPMTTRPLAPNEEEIVDAEETPERNQLALPSETANNDSPIAIARVVSDVPSMVKLSAPERDSVQASPLFWMLYEAPAGTDDAAGRLKT